MAAPISPQPLAVGEPSPPLKESIQNHPNQIKYDARLYQSKLAANLNKTQLKPIELVHGVPTIQFSMDERMEFAKEEGLHQAIVMKQSSNVLDLPTMRTILPKLFCIKGQVLIGQLAPRQLLVRTDQHEDFVNSLARAVQYLITMEKSTKLEFFHGQLVLTQTRRRRRQ